MTANYEDFVELPKRTRAKGKGGGRPPTQLLLDLQGIPSKKKLKLKLKEEFPNAETFEDALNRVRQRVANLPFRPVLSQNPETWEVEVYRPEGSEYAVDAQGNPVLGEPDKRERRRRLTVSDAASIKTE